MQPLDKAFMALFKPRQVITVYQISEQFGNAYKPAARGEIVANGFRPTGCFPCGKNIYRPHDFPLASDGTDAAPVNQTALVKTSDQTLCSSVCIRRSLLLRLSKEQISALCQVWTYSQIHVVEQQRK